MKEPCINFYKHRRILKQYKQAKPRGWLHIHNSAYLRFIENKLEVDIETGKGGRFIANENNTKDNKGETLRLLTARFRDAKY